ncbi:hypothetical protein EVAR_37666_1 [Eumeta japonica]|uniref:Uncharacterized protein n=1 Tax=Eumeta variegata TaxID=151549 RepID=A0A4C1Z033_EUMVA|nr:hypothetical protein EVAR_37666_1 [Eumeta japonica]
MRQYQATHTSKTLSFDLRRARLLAAPASTVRLCTSALLYSCGFLIDRRPIVRGRRAAASPDGVRGVKAETYLRVVACRGAPGAYRFHTFNMVRDIFACRVVTQSVLSWRGLLATDCARAVVGVMARHGTTDKCVSIRRVARGANI